MRTRNLEITAYNLPLLHALGGFVAEQYKSNHVHTVLSTAVPPRTPLSMSTASSPSPLQAATVTSGGTFQNTNTNNNSQHSTVHDLCK